MLKTIFTKLHFIVFLPALLAITGCKGASIMDYKDTKPELKLEQYFDGELTAKGVFQDRFGKIRRRFHVDIQGQWDPESRTLTLYEDFLYHDGETEKRTWSIEKTGENSYKGHAEGVVDQATGQGAGHAFNWRYKFDLPVNGDVWRVNFDDWFYKLDDQTLVNKATVSKFGITLGEVILFFEKKNDKKQDMPQDDKRN